jgi:hypothetical protein
MITLRHSIRMVRALLLVCLALALPTHAQTGAATTTNQPSSANQSAIVAFFSHWDERALQAQTDQPNWLTPVVTSTARLKQELRYDMSWQWNNNGTTTDNYGGSRGLTTMPLARVEVSINLPPYVVHNESNQRDGFGDFSILTKFRILAANRKHGDYVLTAFLATTFPTGSYKNGSAHAVITPTIAGGKGLGDFVYEGSFGCDLPSAQTAILGRRLILNNAFQYRRLEKFWPELEVNSNFYSEGPNDGKKQVFLTPGVSAGRFTIYGHLQLTLAAGVEIAATHFHTFTHQGILSVRLPF